MVRLPADPGRSDLAGVTAANAEPARAARLLHVSGVVQGVGFRPLVHRLAVRHGLAGWVRNSSGDVEIEVEGAPAALDEFIEALRMAAPPLARVAQVQSDRCPPAGRDAFAILPSAPARDHRQPVPPDTALCAACEAELFDPANRRYRYPFITCTDCGPRFTVVEAMPYDRERTSMRLFTQCPACAREYRTPGERRYHSETNSCPACGPRLQYVACGAPEYRDTEALDTAADLIRRGGILAVRGLGGFHLAVDATSEAAVDRLRLRKRRDEKPLAVMVRSLDQAEALAELGGAERRLLLAPERPVVVLRCRTDAGLAAAVAPGLD